jgi:hypothetical protein
MAGEGLVFTLNIASFDRETLIGQDGYTRRSGNASSKLGGRYSEFLSRRMRWLPLQLRG